MVLEYMDCGSLADVLSRHGPLPEPLLATVFQARARRRPAPPACRPARPPPPLAADGALPPSRRASSAVCSTCTAS